MDKGLGLKLLGKSKEEINKESTTDAPLKGMIKVGNIGLRNRPIVKFGKNNEKEGTVHSTSFDEQGVEVLVPTIYDGKKHKRSEAMKRYKQTGKNLGTFDTPENATEAAKYFSRKQGSTYGMGTKKDEKDK